MGDEFFRSTVALKDPKGTIKKYFTSHVGRVQLGLGLMDLKQMVARGQSGKLGSAFSITQCVCFVLVF